MNCRVFNSNFYRGLLQKEWVNTNSAGDREDFHIHNTTARHQWNGRKLTNFALPDPIVFPLPEALEAACPVHDTHAAGVRDASQ
ncbi:MAG: hypothetical protein NTZ51_07465 [Proteobacteria bacterium]|nr:hypothetical protein [Pseudomonadota bacterium]